ncbi:uncharacterized protein LOC143352274 [Halictus rubicundus]|uniref:uncharacterized protein LOC143352274 n=1 Tax=Halictus rubicundus TaxID=77578 RepID=UPI004036C907
MLNRLFYIMNRLREENSDDENAHSFPKKLRALDNKIKFEVTKLERKSDVNGNVANREEDTSIAEGGAKDTNISNSTKDVKDTNISSSKEVARCRHVTEKILCTARSKNQNKEICILNNIRETETEKSTNNEYKLESYAFFLIHTKGHKGSNYEE